MKDAEVIRLIGGARELSRALSISIDAARKFQQRGIPWKYRPAVQKMAKAKRLKLPDDFLDVQRSA